MSARSKLHQCNVFDVEETTHDEINYPYTFLCISKGEGKRANGQE